MVYSIDFTVLFFSVVSLVGIWAAYKVGYDKGKQQTIAELVVLASLHEKMKEEMEGDDE